jgi:hypothetical protein
MRPSIYRVGIVALLLVVAGSFGLQRAARASDAGAILGGVIAGAIVYELLDDDDDYGCSSYYYGSPGYYRPPRYRYYDYGGCDYRPPVVQYRYYDYGPRGRGCGSNYNYYDGPRTSYRAPSHAQRNVGPPPGYGKGGRYRAPGRYYK